MFKINDFYSNSNPTKFMDLLKSNWDNLHDNTDVFRYKINKVEERLINNKYILQILMRNEENHWNQMFRWFRNKIMAVVHLLLLPASNFFMNTFSNIENVCSILLVARSNAVGNKMLLAAITLDPHMLNPDRRTKRRAPEEMESVRQVFDKSKFNFTKVTPSEILFSLEDEASDVHTVLVNVSPISRYHTLLCPSVNKCLPQVVTLESLALAIQVMFIAEDRHLRILFNSLCGYASVNHLHYHLFMEKKDFHVENVKWQHVKDNMYRLDETYPVPGFCFEVERHSILHTSKDIYKVLEYFLNNSIAHNILLTRRQRLGVVDDAVKVIIWPRKSMTGAKQFAAMNVAVLELSGFFPAYDIETFNNLTAEDLVNELEKWKLEDFDKVYEDVKQL